MSQERAHRRIAVVMALDVVGYTALMERDESGTFAKLRTTRDEIVAPEILRCRGRIFKLIGDGALAEFSSAVDAIECAVAIQKQTTLSLGSPPEGRIQLRIGIDLGDVTVEGDDLYGEGVNTASRIQQLADPGGIRISKAAYDQVKNKLALPFVYLGPQKLKNISEPVVIFKIDMSGRGTTHSQWRRRGLLKFTAKAALLVVAVIGLVFAYEKTRGIYSPAPSVKSVPQWKINYGIDFLGFDLGPPLPADKADVCQRLCEDEQKCKAYTFNAVANRCHLKGYVLRSFQNPAIESGYLTEHVKQITELPFVVHEGLDWPGSEYRHIKSLTFDQCMQTCTNETSCKVFSYIASDSQCWLKSGYKDQVYRPEVTSGIKY